MASYMHDDRTNGGCGPKMLRAARPFRRDNHSARRGTRDVAVTATKFHGYPMLIVNLEPVTRIAKIKWTFLHRLILISYFENLL